MSKAQTMDTIQPASNKKMPLSGYTVLDLTIARAGPTAVRLLSDWGANVIRIEPPLETDARTGDLTGGRHSADFQNLHRQKRSLSLNLKSAEGLELFMRLAKSADVIVENFRMEVKYRLGVDYESVRKINPSIIYGSVSGFGQAGPYSRKPGVDQVVQATSGLMSITGEPGRGPMRVGVAISDTAAGMFLGQGIVVALLHRERTGEGQWVHTSLLESMLSKLDFQGARYAMSGEVPQQEGNHHPTNSPMGVFDASDGQVSFAASTDKMFKSFCEVMNARGLAVDVRYRFSEDRVRHRDALNRTINEITSQHTKKDLIERLNSVGCPCGPIYSIAEAFEDEQVRFLKIVRPVTHPKLGELSLVRSPINMSSFPAAERFTAAAPEVGQHSEEILLELGLCSDDITRLRAAGTV